MNTKLENLNKVERRIAGKKLLTLWPGVLCLLVLAVVLLLCAQDGTPSSEEWTQVWSAYGMLAGMYIIISVIFFVSAWLGPHWSIATLHPAEQARVNEDCLKGYRFGDVIICRDCLLMPGVGAKLQAVSYRDLLWIYVDKRYIRYVTRKSAALCPVSRKVRFLPKKLGPELDENGFYTVMQQFLPWCFFGNAPEIRTLHKKNFPALVQTVDGRRASYWAGNGFRRIQ